MLNLSAQKMQAVLVSDHEACKEVSNMLCEVAGILEYVTTDVMKHLDVFPLSRKPLEFFSLSTLKALIAYTCFR